MTNKLTATIKELDRSFAYKIYKDQLEDAFEQIKKDIYRIDIKNNHLGNFDFDGDLMIDEKEIDDIYYSIEELKDKDQKKYFPKYKKIDIDSNGDCQSDWQVYEIYVKKDFNEDNENFKHFEYLLKNSMNGVYVEYFVEIEETQEDGFHRTSDLSFDFLCGIDDDKDEETKRELRERNIILT